MLEFALPSLLLVMVFIYFVFDHFEGRRPQDEREELIQLRAQTLVQKLTLGALSLGALWVFLQPAVAAVYPLMLAVCAHMAGDIVARLYYRRRY